jgi:hypothetical protein
MTVFQLTLPALTSERVDVSLLSTDVADPSALTWQGNVSAAASTYPGPGPSSGWAGASVVNRGTAARSDWRITVLVDSLPAGTYGVWIKVVGTTGTSPVRFAGTLILV